MAKLSHIAIQVPDLEKAAAFYEGVFQLKRLKKVNAPIGNAISLSDGVVNLTLLHFPEGTKGGKGDPDWAGLHQFGFVVEDESATEQAIHKHGGAFVMQLPNYPGVDAGKKYKSTAGTDPGKARRQQATGGGNGSALRDEKTAAQSTRVRSQSLPLPRDISSKCGGRRREK